MAAFMPKKQKGKNHEEVKDEEGIDESLSSFGVDFGSSRVYLQPQPEFEEFFEEEFAKQGVADLARKHNFDKDDGATCLLDILDTGLVCPRGWGIRFLLLSFLFLQLDKKSTAP
jgi:hypothetical protein